MRIIKYFFEEPTLLDFPESASERPFRSDELQGSLAGAPRHYRGYLAATDLESGAIGGSSLEDQAAAKMLAAVVQGPGWFFSKGSESPDDIQSTLLSSRDAILKTLVTMPADSLLVTNFNPQGLGRGQGQGQSQGPIGQKSEGQRSEDQALNALVHRSSENNRFRAIVRLLDIGATVILCEPAHVGHDWSVFSSRPISEMVRSSLLELKPTNCRSFVIPYVKARGEHKFYFEQYDLELFKEHEVK